MAVLNAALKPSWRESRIGSYWANCLLCLLWLIDGAWTLAGGAPGPIPGVAQEEPASTSYELKAAFLYNFIQYVKWPETKEASFDGFALCVLGKNPFGSTLEPLKSKVALKMPITVKELHQIDEARQCHILFISASEQAHLGKVLAEVREAGVLTVGDTDGYAEAGVAINFVIRQHKLRFVINPEAAKNGQVHISAHLLRLAEIVQSP